ncbi:MAG TPA: alpha-ketoglutarate-dependent dioxygenase AlkB [Verrucomicrobiae bacterium]|nr:alpha-ketoglutarate-dependent dioxygenase AlkB [Verrucomicrobiae bacterium]
MSRLPHPADLTLPEGFSFLDGFLTTEEEAELLVMFRSLPFQEFTYHGYVAKRRVLAWGWTYDFSSGEFSRGEVIPGFLLPLRIRAAAAAGIAAEDLVEALLTEYTPGAQIGWHRDLPMFDIIIGISLGGSCTFRLKSYRKGERPLSLILPPRSLYVMRGAARWKYQHSIPPVDELRYSITFRTMKK